MFVRAKKRFKDGKEHRYWSVVENCRNPNGRVVQRQVLYLGEINDSQLAAWCRSIEVLCAESGPKPVALFPADREAPELDCEVVRVELKGLRLCRARQWGACWLALVVWERLDLDRFWRVRLPVSRQGTPGLSHAETCFPIVGVSRVGGRFFGAREEANGCGSAATQHSERGLVGDGAGQMGARRGWAGVEEPVRIVFARR